MATQIKAINSAKKFAQITSKASFTRTTKKETCAHKIAKKNNRKNIKRKGKDIQENITGESPFCY